MILKYDPKDRLKSSHPQLERKSLLGPQLFTCMKGGPIKEIAGGKVEGG